MKRKAFLIVLGVLVSLTYGVKLNHAADKGSMWAEKLPAFDIVIKKRVPFEHPYVCVKSGQCYALSGRNSGGNLLSGTWGVGDRDKTRCVAKESFKCAVIWGVTGTSQQEGNRMLWPAGTKVTEAKGYWVLYPLFGHYGNASAAGLLSWTWCKKACKL